MKRLSTLVLPLIVVATLSACKRDAAQSPDTAAQAAPAAVESTSAPAPAAAGAAPASTPAAASPAAATATAAKPFDLNTVAVTDKPLPAFPYLTTPEETKDYVSIEKDLDFERMYVLAGDSLHRVEGRVLVREFSMQRVKWSSVAAHRNYETALKALGATRVDTVHPANKQFIERNGGNQGAIVDKMGTKYLNPMEDAEIPGFEQWLLRTPTTNIWIGFYVDGGTVGLVTIEEKAMQQVIQAVSAGEPTSAAR